LVDDLLESYGDFIGFCGDLLFFFGGVLTDFIGFDGDFTFLKRVLMGFNCA